MSKTRLVIFAAVLVMLSAATAACAGYDLGDMVRVKTPPAIQQQTGLPSSTTLNEAEAEYQAWLEDVQRASVQWKGSIEKGNEVRALLNQITLSALNDVGPTLAGLPLLGPVLPAATGLLGLFLGAGRMRKEKEASFRKGQEEAVKLVPREILTSRPAVPTP